MAGHSKWSNIKHKKKIKDLKRCKIFSKISKEISIASQLGGTSTYYNLRLRTAVNNAFNNNISKNIVDRAIKNGSGCNNKDKIQSVYYTGLFFSRTIFIVHCLTDNKNRMIAELRCIFNKYKIKMLDIKDSSYLFETNIHINLSNKNIISNDLLNLNIEKILEKKSYITIIVKHNNYSNIKKFLNKKNISILSFKTFINIKNKIIIQDKNKLIEIKKIIYELKSLKDVVKLYNNINNLHKT